MFSTMKNTLYHPFPIQNIRKKLVERFTLGSYHSRLQISAMPRPHYGYCLYHAAILAHRLGLEKMSAIEFGVAGGNGLVNMEWHANEIRKIVPIEIEIYGFDTGEGLPSPVDYRDLKYHWKEGFFKMDIEKLKDRLCSAKLVFGNIKDTVPTFLDEHSPAPIGVMFHDFDFYSSTMESFQLLDKDPDYFLPRVFNYFDDIIGGETELYNNYTGERLAIEEFNAKHSNIKFSPAYYLLAKPRVFPWYHQIQILHFLGHSKYNEFVSKENQQNALYRE